MRTIAFIVLFGSAAVAGLSGAYAEEETAAVNGLRLEAKLAFSEGEVVSGETVRLVATFRNVGDAPIEIHLPEHIGHVVFPAWILTDEAGQEWVPVTHVFQSMWTQGLQGEILRLEPGSRRHFTIDRVHFVRRTEGGAALTDQAPVALAPGRYMVRAVYERKDDLVPYGEPNFVARRKPHEGLWTGAVQSEAIPLVVIPSGKPTITVEAERIVEAGAPYPVRVRIANPGPEPISVNGAFVVRAVSKAWGQGSFRFVMQGAKYLPAPGDYTHFVHLDPGQELVAAFDLAAQTLSRQQGGRARQLGLYDVVPEGAFHLSASFLPQGSTEPLASQGMYRSVREMALGARTVRGLQLRLERSEIRRGQSPSVEVILSNAGSEGVHVPAHLLYPRHVFFSIRQPGSENTTYTIRSSAGDLSDLMNPDEPGPLARVQEGLMWDGDRFEPTPGDDALSFVLLPPGGEIRRRFHLGEILAGEDALAFGTWEVRAFWRNRESGRRLGLAPPLAVGLVASEPLVVGGRGW
ncbi:MAG: hypothetical protein ACYTG6_11385 [Planctomycetota bacterium]|jgi:hypothetical protein